MPLHVSDLRNKMLFKKVWKEFTIEEFIKIVSMCKSELIWSKNNDVHDMIQSEDWHNYIFLGRRLLFHFL